MQDSASFMLMFNFIFFYYEFCLEFSDLCNRSVLIKAYHLYYKLQKLHLLQYIITKKLPTAIKKIISKIIKKNYQTSESAENAEYEMSILDVTIPKIHMIITKIYNKFCAEENVRLWEPSENSEICKYSKK